mmetsp:Transcript_17531/g.42147  ORF Transcript_17531/g.42147 Transcript_17531/m.42147 type:complete len:254 (+) Transcript_17531:1551-2312(+)
MTLSSNNAASRNDWAASFKLPASWRVFPSARLSDANDRRRCCWDCCSLAPSSSVSESISEAAGMVPDGGVIISSAGISVSSELLTVVSTPEPSSASSPASTSEDNASSKLIPGCSVFMPDSNRSDSLLFPLHSASDDCVIMSDPDDSSTTSLLPPIALSVDKSGLATTLMSTSGCCSGEPSIQFSPAIASSSSSSSTLESSVPPHLKSRRGERSVDEWNGVIPRRDGDRRLFLRCLFFATRGPSRGENAGDAA